MEFTFSHAGNVGVYKLKGNLIGEKDGIPIAEAFADELENGTRKFVIDLSELQHINSTGLGVLITLHTKTRKQEGGEMALAGPSAYIQNLLKITKLNTIFSIFETTDEALSAIA
ncbi:STAS domain-containing protein [Pontibacter sp. G13]|uniref:STAS domain-containing protein n=1 Tax=Pontibacter sp. G13 TaxID=3074898 RepID=UPI00288A1616|nr:STAS domain-containing protein [Pontibacter sp. G13]WNJ17470.1 STAS domain-containing protein [Pontibacter sp. G13]